VRSDQDRPAVGPAAPEDVVEHVSTVGIESRVWLVQEQEPWRSGQSDREGQTSSLPCGEASVADVGKWTEPEAVDGCRGVVPAPTGCSRGKGHVLGHGEVVVAAGVVTDQRQLTTVSAPVHDQIVAEDARLTRMERNEPGQDPEERRLASPVATCQQHHLASADVEIDARERGEPTEQTDGGAETDDRFHNASRGVRAQCTKPSIDRANRRAGRRIGGCDV
jgi:hypothetical protein